jgi:ATP-binding cassette subfamily C exporter for protease/lipase
LAVDHATLLTANGLPLLRDLRFAVARGQAVAVVGPSGAGKTTLARLLIGVLACTRGSVRLDGVDMATWSKDQLGRHVGYLPQSVEVMDGTVADNIARFDVADEAAVLEAVRLVGLDTWINTLPEGIHTRVGPQGAFLSGGQRQRLALARACYRRPTFLVLDEPDASLDDVGEMALANAVGQLRASGAMVVCITHRKALVAACSHLLVLSEGVQLAFGPVAEVMANANKTQQTQVDAIQRP